MRWVSKGSRAARRRRQQRGGRRTRAPTPVGGSEQAQEALRRTEGNPEAEGPPSPTRPRSGPRQGACATSLAGPRSPLLQVPPLTPGLASASAAGESGESRTRARPGSEGGRSPPPSTCVLGTHPRQLPEALASATSETGVSQGGRAGRVRQAPSTGSAPRGRGGDTGRPGLVWSEAGPDGSGELPAACPP